MTMNHFNIKKGNMFSNRVASVIPALLSLPLWLAAACVPADQDGTTATRNQALGAGCTLFRPVAWGSAPECAEGEQGSISMDDGEIYWASSNGVWPWGSGEAEIQCQDGFVTLIWWSCVPGGG
jgi:hypothetical protein